MPEMIRIRDVIVPNALLRVPERFGGEAVRGARRGDLLLSGGAVAGMARAEATGRPRLLLPALVEVHCHLDKCHSAHRMPPLGGDLAAAIAAQARDKRHWTEADLRARMGRGLAEAQAAGVRQLRSHIDWGPSAEVPLAWRVLGDMDAGAVQVQRAALVSAPQMADAATGEAIARQVAEARGALGLYVLHQPDRAAAVRAAFRLADRFGLPLDFHVDESLDAGCDGLELIAEAARETRFEGPVLCGHACALMSKPAEAAARLMAAMAEAGLAVAALPWTNLWLQGRGPGTPDRRGITRLRELRAAGVRVTVGSDNVADAFCPTGAHDPMAALGLAVLAGHLDPPLEDWLTAITVDAAAAMGAEPVFVEDAKAGDLRLWDGDAAAVLAGRAGRPQALSGESGA